MRAKRLATAALLLSAFLVGCRDWSDFRTVARVGSLRITLGEFRDHFRVGRDPARLSAVPMEDRKRHLNRLIEARMKYLEAKRLGLDHDSSYVARFKDVRDRTVMEEMMRERVLYKIVPERVVKKWYKYSGIGVRVKSILISTKGDSLPEQILAKGHRAWQIYDLLRQGVPFDSLARQYSDNDAERRSGGNPRWIRLGLYPFELCVKLFDLEEGEFSKPIRTARGYQIFYVVEKKIVPSHPLRLVRFQVLGMIRQSVDYRDRIKEALDRYIQEVKERYGYEEDKWTWNHLSGLMKIRKAMVLGGQTEEGSDQFEVVPEKSYKYVLCRWKGDSLTIGDVIEYVKKQNPRRQPDFTDEATRRSWIQGIAHQKLLTQHAYELGYQNDPDVKEQLRNYELRVLPTIVDNRLVREKVEVTEEELRQYFESHRLDFVVPAARLVREILLSDYDVAEEVARRAKAGEDFIELVRQFNERQSTKDKDGLLGWVGEKAFGDLGSRAVQLHKGDVDGPISVGRKWSVIRIEDERPERLKSFEEARKQVEGIVRQQKARQLMRELLAQLRQRYRPVVFEKALEDAFPLPKL